MCPLFGCFTVSEQDFKKALFKHNVGIVCHKVYRKGDIKIEGKHKLMLGMAKVCQSISDICRHIWKFSSYFCLIFIC